VASITDVARIAGVSIATVSHVINGTKRVSDATRQRVEDAIEASAFVPNVGAQSLRNGRTRSIGLVAFDVTQTFFFAPLISSIEGAARADGQTLLLTNSRDDPRRERDAVRAMLDRRVDGLIVTPVGGSDPAVVEMCRRAGCPVVFVDRIGDNTQDQVGIDNRAAMARLTRHLVATGYRRIALIAGDPGVWTQAERLRGFEDALAGSDAEAVIVLADDPSTDDREHVVGLMSGDQRPDAVIAANEWLAMGAMHAFKQVGIRFPEDVAFASFDGVVNSEFFESQLTCVVQPVEQMGAEAMRLLRRRMAEPQARPDTVIVPASLVHGSSCGCGGTVPL
jgi:LacI family transcriptional regulator